MNKCIPLLLLMLTVFSSQLYAQQNKAPGFALFSTEGKMVTLSSLAKQPVILAFWADYCAPCKKEIPQLAAIEKKYASKNVKLVLVNIDAEGKKAAEPFCVKQKIDAVCLLDMYQETIKKYMAGKDLTVPATFVIVSGVILFSAIGFDEKNITQIDETIAKLP